MVALRYIFVAACFSILRLEQIQVYLLKILFGIPYLALISMFAHRWPDYDFYFLIYLLTTLEHHFNMARSNFLCFLTPTPKSENNQLNRQYPADNGDQTLASGIESKCAIHYISASRLYLL